jgi:3,4-dihydroxy 2-butanone 4-phosphate synthase
MTFAQMDFLTDMDEKLSPNLRKAVMALRAGQPVLLIDDSHRENEGDLIVAAQKITADSMNFLIQHGSGVVCISMEDDRLKQLEIPMMAVENTNHFNTAFTVSIEATTGITTGVSAADRARTVLVAASDDSTASDLRRPGHVFPLRASNLGVLKRQGHTEGSVDLMKLSSMRPMAVLCELMNSDGTMAVGQQRCDFAAKWQMPTVSVAEVLFFRLRHEEVFASVPKVTALASKFGDLRVSSYQFFDGRQYQIFARPNFKDCEETKVALVLDGNLRERLVEQITLPDYHDPLALALMALADGKQDLVLFSPEQTLHQGGEAMVAGQIGRCLQNHAVKKMRLSKPWSYFADVAEKYFDIRSF